MRPKPPLVQVVVAVSSLLLLTALYLALMRLSIDVSSITDQSDADRRDLVYFLMHLGVLVFAAAIGFALGKWLNGLGFAYAVLFVIVIALAMALAQLGSHELACTGHNDLIRHWQC